MSELLQVLIKVRNYFLDNPAGWTKQQLAYDQYDFPVDPLSPIAVKFCLVGRLFYECGKNDGLRNNIMEYLRKYIEPGYYWLSMYNDEAGYKVVIDLLNKAISDLEKDICQNKQ